MRDVIDRIVFLDLETTGFDERKGCILEAAYIICDVNLNEIARNEVVIKPTAVGMHFMDPTALVMHEKSGLMRRTKSALWTTLEAEDEALELFALHGCQPKRTTIAGGSVGFDVRWLREHMPRLYDFFHYRVLDVSGFHAAAGFWGVAPEKPVSKHRALSDCADALAGARYYRERVFMGQAARNPELDSPHPAERTGGSVAALCNSPTFNPQTVDTSGMDGGGAVETKSVQVIRFAPDGSVTVDVDGERVLTGKAKPQPDEFETLKMLYEMSQSKDNKNPAPASATPSLGDGPLANYRFTVDAPPPVKQPEPESDAWFYGMHNQGE